MNPDDILLTGRSAVVTGGGAGIGRGVALGLARFGCDVAVIDVDPSTTEAEVTGLGRRGLSIVGNVMDSASLRSGISQAFETFGRLDILVNNAGGVRPGPFLTQPEESMRRHIELNFVSAVLATQTAARHMIEGGRGGSVVNVVSIEGFRAAPMFAVYAACKAGLINFTRTAALELAEHSIRVNAIAPDRTDTPGLRSAGGITSATRAIPLSRIGTVDECASAVVWLCSEMSSYVTGVTLNVDGGTWAGGGWFRTGDGGWSVEPVL